LNRQERSSIHMMPILVIIQLIGKIDCNTYNDRKLKTRKSGTVYKRRFQLRNDSLFLRDAKTKSILASYLQK
jgi:hypothetical protein